MVRLDVMWGLTFDMSGGRSKRSLLEDVRSMEGLGDSFKNATLEAWRKVPPGSEHEQRKHGVAA